MQRKINKIIVHCSDSPEGREDTIDDIRLWHMNERGWSDVGYHYVIHLDGSIHVGREVNTQGAHVKGHNKGSIGVCYVGGADIDFKPKDTRTCEQKESLEIVLQYLKRVYPRVEILGHRDLSSKACPSFDAKNEYGWISDRC